MDSKFLRPRGRAIFFSFVFLALPISSAVALDQILANFPGAPGATAPGLSLSYGPNNVIYGTTPQGGATGKGTLYRYQAAAGANPAKIKVLYEFKGGANGGSPSGPLAFDGAGNGYGVAQAGGVMSDCGGAGCGVVYKFAPPSPGHPNGVVSIIWRFHHVAGSSPTGALAIDGNGRLYGTTTFGGGQGSCSGDMGGCGVAYGLAPPTSGNAWQFTVLHRFTDATGAVPNGDMVFDAAKKNLFGTTQGGGTSPLLGVVFRMVAPPSGQGAWAYKVLHNFSFQSGMNNDGANPVVGVTIDGAGNLYGTTSSGGSANCPSGCGTAFKLTKSGNTWTHGNIHVFTGGSDGRNVKSALTRDGTGNLYGATVYGGGSGCGIGCGVVFRLAPNGMTYNHSVLHTFQNNGVDGIQPQNGALLWNGAQAIFGTTISGGSAFAGTLFRVVLP